MQNLICKAWLFLSAGDVDDVGVSPAAGGDTCAASACATRARGGATPSTLSTLTCAAPVFLLPREPHIFGICAGARHGSLDHTHMVGGMVAMGGRGRHRADLGHTIAVWRALAWGFATLTSCFLSMESSVGQVGMSPHSTRPLEVARYRSNPLRGPGRPPGIFRQPFAIFLHACCSPLSPFPVIFWSPFGGCAGGIMAGLPHLKRCFGTINYARGSGVFSSP